MPGAVARPPYYQPEPPPHSTPGGEIRENPLSTRAYEYLKHDLVGIPRPGAPRTDWLPLLTGALSGLSGAPRFAKQIRNYKTVLDEGMDGILSMAEEPVWYFNPKRTGPLRVPEWFTKLVESQLDPHDLSSYAKRIDVRKGFNHVDKVGEYSSAMHQVVDRRKILERGHEKPRFDREATHLRNMDHGFQSTKDFYEGAPPLAILARALGYNALKYVAQNVPEQIGRRMDDLASGGGRLMGNVSDFSGQGAGALTRASKPTIESFLWGIRPLWAKD